MSISAIDQLQALAGMAPWAVKRGFVGSFLTLDFGSKITIESREGRKHIVGEYRLWIVNSAWTLHDGPRVSAASDDEPEDREPGLEILTNLPIVRIGMDSSHSTQIEFEDSRVLRILGIRSNGDFDQWILYTPGGIFSLEAAGTVREAPPRSTARLT